MAKKEKKAAAPKKVAAPKKAAAKKAAVAAPANKKKKLKAPATLLPLMEKLAALGTAAALKKAKALAARFNLE